MRKLTATKSSGSQGVRGGAKRTTSDTVVVSLFSGAGGLDLGFVRAGFDVRVALDKSDAAMRTYRRNFEGGNAESVDLASLGPAGIVELVSRYVPQGNRIGVIGGPPCQGFSRANTQSKRADPRKALTRLYADAIVALSRSHSLEFVVFENVPGFADDRNTYSSKHLRSAIRAAGLCVRELTLNASEFGVPQRRERLILVAARDRSRVEALALPSASVVRTVREAIGGLPEPSFFVRGQQTAAYPLHPNHWTMRPRSRRFSEAGGITPGGRSFKLLHWDRPSPTVAYGNREIHVHPSGRRRLSVFEAMLLQGFPAEFVLEGNFSEQVTQVSNAVPPPLAEAVARSVRYVIGGDGG